MTRTISHPETREEARTRLAWMIAATGYDPDAPGAFYPHIFHADGSVDYRDGSLRWRAGEEEAHLSGPFTADELIDIGTHMGDIERALWAVRDEGATPPPAPAMRSRIAPPAPLTPRIRLAFGLLHLALRAVPAGSSRDMLRHLVRHWRGRWYVGADA